ncbi:MAG: hypothetical protein HYZ91_03405 [Candidatus Omnitrophica bacterium]|nr:hypothetical protein [Candidatus Omnitrophota bacterium]
MAGVLLIGVLWGVALFPVHTKQGVDYQIVSRPLPLYLKVMGFLLRDAEYRRLAKAITHGQTTDEARALVVFQWTREHIRPTPRDWPAVDDHIANIIIRGYGADDQRADVFTTLLTYAGVLAYWKIIVAEHGAGKLVLSFVRINGQWTVWDVERGLAFRDAQGRLASVAELAQNPALLGSDGLAAYRGQPYRQYVEHGLASLTVPDPLRAEEQMPMRRLLAETRRMWQRVWRHY